VTNRELQAHRPLDRRSRFGARTSSSVCRSLPDQVPGATPGPGPAYSQQRPHVFLCERHAFVQPGSLG